MLKNDRLSDAELLGAYYAREEDAVARTDEQYGNLIEGICRSVLSDGRDVEECRSETLFLLWNSIPPAHPENLKAYICRTARNCALDRRRTDDRQKRCANAVCLDAEDELSDLFDGGDLPEERLLTGELTAIIEAFLDGLSSKCRKMFVWRFWFGLSAGEVAARCGVSERAVRMQIAHAKEKLRKRLKKEGYLE
ncbi:MAG: sigma-70 family RNA polymerase sigma factor [Clostridia bacterium]|nr:sigma-70 family RNA polymerase sigma factor [Clostridia bacterium]